MKKTLGILAMLLTIHSAAQALHCRELSAASGQGYEVISKEGRAMSLSKNGKKIAILKFQVTEPSAGGDMENMMIYRQDVANGYQVILNQGGLAVMKTADVYLGGYAGYKLIKGGLNCDPRF